MKARIFIIAAAAAMLAACGSQKQATGTSTATTLTPEADATPVQRYASMTSAYGLWHDVRMPMRATLRSPMSISASGTLTMVRDELIHASVRVLGIEVAVLRATPDSIYLVDKFHRYLVAEPTAAVTARTGLTLPDMQSLLLGRACIPGAGTATPSAASQLRITADGADGIAIAPATAPKAYDWTMKATRLADDRMALTSVTVSPKGGNAATCTFTPAASLTTIGAMASAMTVKASVAKKTVDATLSYTLSDASYNATAAPAMPSLKGYKRVDAAAILKAGIF
ncbi:MAG: DUF4292 domain-containing protein [Muribaculaceae bacterium]|nr:DUF4292 domain-containing protein [Muribaculaceae bacterium]